MFMIGVGDLNEVIDVGEEDSESGKLGGDQDECWYVVKEILKLENQVEYL